MGVSLDKLKETYHRLAEQMQLEIQEQIMLEEFRGMLRGAFAVCVSEDKQGEWSFMLDELTNEELIRLKRYIMFSKVVQVKDDEIN